MTKIIIVEDDPMISEIYQKKFSESDFEVLVADSGEQALELVKKNEVDLILLDLIMPKMDGFEVIKNIRSGNYNQKAKIIVFSNLSQKEDQDKAIKLGADGFIIKSDYTPSALIDEVKRIFNQCREEEKNKNKEKGKVEEDKEKKVSDKEEVTIVKPKTAKRVLLIEDEDVFVEMFTKKLTEDGYVVESAKNGAWGLKEALNKYFDILIVDIVMPAMNGDEIVATLKQNEKTKNIPIIVLSASVGDEIKKKVEKLGVSAFFVKTQLVPSELSKEVTKLLK